LPEDIDIYPAGLHSNPREYIRKEIVPKKENLISENFFNHRAGGA
jgi:hypothetical protein